MTAESVRTKSMGPGAAQGRRTAGSGSAGAVGRDDCQVPGAPRRGPCGGPNARVRTGGAVRVGTQRLAGSGRVCGVDPHGQQHLAPTPELRRGEAPLPTPAAL